MKVLLISGEYPPHMFGGGASFMYHLSRYLSRIGIFTTVVAHRLVSNPLDAGKTEIEQKNEKLRVVWVSVPRFAYPRHEVFQLLSRKIVSSLISEHDIIHMNTGLYYPWIRGVIKRIRKPVIITIHGDPILVNRIQLRSRYISITNKIYGIVFIKEASAGLKHELMEQVAVLVSEHLYKSLKEKFSQIRRHRVIYNGINTDYIIKSLRTESRSSYYKLIAEAKKRGYKIMAYPARFYPVKNHIALIATLPHILERHRRTILVLTSDGPMKPIIKMYARKVGIENKVIFTGRIPYPEALRIISLADLIPFPSLYEACPISVIEASILKKKVVAFRLPYSIELKEYLDNLIIVKDFRSFIDAVRDYILHHPPVKQHLSQQEDYMSKLFDAKKMTQEYVNLYMELLNNSK